MHARRYGPPPFVPLVILALAFALRAFGLASQSLWYDEGYTVMFAQHDLPDLVAGAAQLELNTPLHYVLLHFWMGLGGTSEFSVRLLSVFAGVITVALAGVLARLVAPNRPAAMNWAMGLTALWPVCVAFSQEVRMYGLLVCLLALSVVLMLHAMRTRNTGAWLAWGACAVATFATHVLGALVFGAQLLVLAGWWLKQPRKPRAPPLAALTSGSVMLAWAVYLLSHAQTYGTTYSNRLEFLAVLWQSLAANLLPRLQPEMLVSLAALACAAVILWLALSGGRQIAFMLIASILLIAAFCALTGKFVARYAAVTAPLVAASLGVCLGAVMRKRAAFATPTGIAAGLLCVAGFVALKTEPRYANEDYRGAVAYIQMHAQPDEAVLLVSGHFAPVYEYYAGPQGWAALPPDPVLNVKNTLTYDTTAPLLNQTLSNRHGAWLLLWQDDIIDPSGIVQTLLQRISHELQPAQTLTQFTGLRLLHYRFDDAYVPLPASIPPLQSRKIVTERQHGLDSLGCTQFRPSHAAQAMMEFACFWQLQAGAGLPYDTKVSLRLFTTDGRLVVQDDQMLAPMKGLPQVPFGKPLTSFYFLHLPAGTPAGRYVLRAIPYTSAEQISPELDTPIDILP